MKIPGFKLSSINSRLILGTIIVVGSFMMLTGLTLSKTFYDSAYSAVEDRLTGQVYLLMADQDIKTLNIDSEADEFANESASIASNLNLSNSGVYSQLSGYITQSDGTIIWQSDVNISLKIPPEKFIIHGKQDHGKKIFQKYHVNGRPYISLSIAIFWDLENPRFPLIYHISDDLTQLNEKLSNYKFSLWSNLLLMSTFLFITLFLILRWGLKPLRDVEKEIKSVEQGEQELLIKSYPDEIVPLTHSINQLIQYERQQQLRYRNALADLAHSLKTPLAIIRGQSSLYKNSSVVTSKEVEANNNSINEAVDRMNSIIEYQLQRAGSNSPSSHIQYLQLSPIVQMLIDSMKKIYREKSIHFHLNMDKDIQFKMDEGDFMEVLGNLLDNACKWCRQDIQLNLKLQEKNFEIYISDDGPGIAADMINEITKRGVRADEFTPGHGVGLAIVQDIVSTYNGKINFVSPPSSGLEIKIYFKLS